jgi:hypothetical protein
MQKEISDLYSLRNAGVKTQESFAKSQAKTQIRNLYLKGDTAGANEKMKALGLTKQETTNLVESADVPSDVRLFKMLSEPDQEDLVRKMNMVELNRYGWYATKDLRAKFSSVSENTKNFVDLVAQGAVKKPIWKKNQNINQ